jgi:hypothetical protein
MTKSTEKIAAVHRTPSLVLLASRHVPAAIPLVQCSIMITWLAISACRISSAATIRATGTGASQPAPPLV